MFFIPKGPKQDSFRKGKKRKYDSDVSSCLCFFLKCYLIDLKAIQRKAKLLSWILIYVNVLLLLKSYFYLIMNKHTYFAGSSQFGTTFDYLCPLVK